MGTTFSILSKIGGCCFESPIKGTVHKTAEATNQASTSVATTLDGMVQGIRDRWSKKDDETRKQQRKENVERIQDKYHLTRRK